MPTQEEIAKMSPEEIAKLQKENCIFCKIIKGEIPSKKVYEDDTTVAILDINPARKGHVLVMPKEHYPILPLVPPEVFQKIFSATKLISAGVKKAMLVSRTTIFLANGAVAGQQSPHFLFHIIPREHGDKLNNFDLPPNPAVKDDNESLFEPLKNNLTIMMSRFREQIGKSVSQDESAQPSQSQSGTPSPDAKAAALEKREKIAKILEENEQVRDLIMNDPKQFKNVISTNAELTELFHGVNLEALAKNLKELQSNEDIVRQEQELKEQKEKEAADQSEESVSNKEVDQPRQEPTPSPTASTPPHASNAFDQQDESALAVSSSVADYAKGLQPAPLPQPAPSAPLSPPTQSKAPEVFLGEDPHAQRDAVFKYFEEKPRAKQLLIDNPQEFMGLLEQRPDVQPLFKDVNVELLAKKLKEREATGGEE